MKTNKLNKNQAPNLEVNSKNDIKNIASLANRLLKGIDNETMSVKKDQDSINKRIEKVNESIVTLTKVITAVTNAAITNSSPSPTKTEKAHKPAPTKTASAKTNAATSKTKKVEKPANTAKPAKAAKPNSATKNSAQNKPQAKAPAAPKAEKPKATKVAKATEERPALKTVIDRILASKNEAVKASFIYNEACRLHGQWSRQSLYNALKDVNRYNRNGDGNDATYKLVTTKVVVTDDDTDKLIQKVETSAAVANVL